MRRITILFAALLCSILSASGFAQTATYFGPNPIDNEGDLFTGRVSAMVASPTDADLWFAAGADGGIWRTTDGGANWTPLTDDMPAAAIGALAMDPADEDIIYAGTGEANYANHSRYGLGIYKTTDGGDTWEQFGESVFAGRTISALVVSHDDSDVIYAGVGRAGGFPDSVEMTAAKGHPQREGDRGVFRSLDGGETWALLPNLPNLAVTDLVMHPTNEDILYAGVGRIFGDADNGIYRTIDGGSTWTKLTTDLPIDVGRISLAISPDMPDRMFALITNPSSVGAVINGIYRSENGGDNWTFLPNSVADSLFDPMNGGLSQAFFGWYLSYIHVEPGNPNRVYAGGFNLVRTDDAGETWVDVVPPHVDQHAFAWAADGTILSGSDGGVFSSTDMGTNWTARNNGLFIVQFYAGMSLAPDDPELAIGGTQDNGTNQRGDGGPWIHIFGGDGGWTQFDPTDSMTRYVQPQGSGQLYRINPDNSIDNLNDQDPPQLGGRTAFFAPFLIDPNNRDRILYASNFIIETLDRGDTWTVISGDVTAGTGAVRSMVMAPSNTDVIYIATNDGLVQRSGDGGETFTMIAENIPGWPRTTRELFVHPTNPMIVYLAVAQFGVDQIRRSEDGGATWQILDGDLPDIPINTIAVDTRATDLRDGVIYAGSDSGMYVSTDDGATWQKFTDNLPNAAFIDLIMDEPRGRLIATTQGRGSWSMPANLPRNLQVVVRGEGTVTSSDDSIDCPGDCNETYLTETTVTLTATPGPGQQFLNWAGDCSGQTCVVNTSESQRVIAIFADPGTFLIDGYE